MLRAISKLILILFFALIFFGQIVFASEFFIDSNTGSDQNPGTVTMPWRSIAKANSMLSAGDTVYLRSGIYSDKIVPKRSGEPGNYITYKKYPNDEKWSATITSSSYGAYLNNVDYVRIVGLNFENCGSNWIYLFDGSDNNIIENCHFFDSFSGGGIRFKSNCKFNTITNCFITKDSPVGDNQSNPEDFIEFRDDSDYNRIIGCYFTGKVSHAPVDITDSSWNVIRDCEIANKWHTGIIINMSNTAVGTTLVEGCFFYNQGSDYATNPNSDTRTDNAYDNTALQMIGKNCIVRGNKFKNNNTSISFGGYISSGHTRKSNGSKVYQNTVYKSIHHINMYMNNSVEVMNVTFKNNIFWDSISKEINNITDYGNPVNFFVANSWTPNANSFYFKNTSSANRCLDSNTLSDCKAGYLKQLYPEEWHVSNLSADPEFNNVTNNDFTLKASSKLIDAGVWLTAIKSESGHSVDSFQVDDAYYFYDGWGIPGENGDSIKTENGQTTSIQHINYETNTIFVSPPIDVVRGEGLALVYDGSKPDIGAEEYKKSASLEAPIGVIISSLPKTKG